MDYIVAIVLGFVQGLTEFIPISSSGHLIIAREFLGTGDFGGLSFDAVLQLATALSLVVFFRKDIWNIVVSFFRLIFGKVVDENQRVLLLAVILGTIPAVIFGLLLESKMDTVFRNIHLVALTLILGSILFWIAEKVAKQDKPLTLGRGILIGFFQCLALVPGMSRSGSTISGGLIAGLHKDTAVRFSFILSIPIILGSGFKKLFEVRSELFTSDLGLSLLLGSAVAFITGLFAISFLIKYLKNHSLNVFIWYRVILAVVLLIYTF